METNDLKSILQAEIDDSIGFIESETVEQRKQALEAYLRQPYGNEVEGKSQIVTGEVAEAIDGALPSLVRIFTGMGLAPIDVQGPVVAVFPGVPASCTLRAMVFRDATARAAGSPDLVIRQGGKEVLRRTLAPTDERVEVAVPLAGGAFELELARTDGQLAGTFAVLERAMLVPR